MGRFSPPPRGSSARPSSARPLSSQRYSVRQLCFAPLPAEELEIESKELSMTSTSLSSLSDRSTSYETELSALVVSPLVEGTSFKLSSNACSTLMTPVANDLPQLSPKQRSFNVSSSATDLCSKSHSEEGETLKYCTKLDIETQNEEEVDLIAVAYEHYLGNIQKAGCLLTLMKELGAGESSTECELWLKRLEFFLGIPREKLAGITPCGGKLQKRLAFDHCHVLSKDEVLLFLTWLKSSHNDLVQSSSVQRASADGVELGVKGPDSTKTEPHGRRKKKKRERGRKNGCSSARGRKNRSPEKSSNPAASALFNQVHDKEVLQADDLGKSAFSVTFHRYMLELHVFEELGGGSNGGGTIRLVDLKHLLRKFHIQVKFDMYVGSIIDTNCTGRINFSEFLWILEFGLGDKGSEVEMAQGMCTSIAGRSTPRNTKSRASRRAGSCSPGRRNGCASRKSDNCVSGWWKWSAKMNSEDGGPPVLHAEEWQQGLPQVNGRPKKGNREKKRSRAVEDVQKGFLERIEKMSPYLNSIGRMSDTVRMPPKKHHHHSERKIVSARSVERTRLPDYDSRKSMTFSGNPCSSIRGRSAFSTAPSISLLRALRLKQARITKKLETLTIPPTDPRHALKRQEELQSTQNELSVVLSNIGTVFRQMAMEP